MKVRLDYLSIMVKVDGGDITFQIDPSQRGARLWAKPETPIRIYPSLLKQLKSIKRVPLDAQDVLAANDELRALLQKDDRQVLDTTFWYNLGSPTDEIVFSIDDLDPTSHRTISIGSFTGSLSSCSPHSAAFLERIRQSKLCVEAKWDDFHRINVLLRPNSAKAANRLRTYEALLGRF